MRKASVAFLFPLWILSACANLPRPLVMKDPLSAQEHQTLGDSYFAQGEKDLATQQYQAALQEDRHFKPALIALGNRAYETRDWSKAESYFKRALKVSAPHDAAASNNLTMVYLAEGKHLDRAKQLIADALPGAGPLAPYLWDTSARLDIQSGDYAAAQLALGKARAAAPPNDPDFQKHLDESFKLLPQSL